MGSVKVYKIVKKILLIAGGSGGTGVVSCVESDPEACKKLIDEARNQMKKILASDPSIKKEIEGHANGPGSVVKGNPARPNAGKDAIFQTSLTAIESALQ